MTLGARGAVERHKPLFVLSLENVIEMLGDSDNGVVAAIVLIKIRFIETMRYLSDFKVSQRQLLTQTHKAMALDLMRAFRKR